MFTASQQAKYVLYILLLSSPKLFTVQAWLTPCAKAGLNSLRVLGARGLQLHCDPLRDLEGDVAIRVGRAWGNIFLNFCSLLAFGQLFREGAACFCVLMLH